MTLKDCMENIKTVNIFDVAYCERAKKGKVYPDGCSLIGLSATSGQLEYLSESSEVASKYAVIIPKDIDGFYLYLCVMRVSEKYFSKYIETMSLPFESLKYLNFQIHEDKTVIENIVECQKQFDDRIETEKKDIYELQEFKKNMLGRMFPK